MNKDELKREKAFAILYMLVRQKFLTITGKPNSVSFSAFRKNKIVKNVTHEVMWVRKEQSKDGVLRIACILYDPTYLKFAKSLGFDMHKSFGGHYAGYITDFDRFIEEHKDVIAEQETSSQSQNAQQEDEENR
jgi:hypothetical protein